MNDEMKVVIFKLGKEEYCFPITQVKEILALCKVTRLPESPEYIEGITNIRGQIVTIMNIAKKLDMECEGFNQIVIIESSKQVVGILVDRVIEVTNIDSKCIESMTNIDATFDKIAKLGERLVVVLDADKII